jgi:hypothetical protein
MVRIIVNLILISFFSQYFSLAQENENIGVLNITSSDLTEQELETINKTLPSIFTSMRMTNIMTHDKIRSILGEKQVHMQYHRGSGFRLDRE